MSASKRSLKEKLKKMQGKGKREKRKRRPGMISHSSSGTTTSESPPHSLPSPGPRAPSPFKATSSRGTNQSCLSPSRTKKKKKSTNAALVAKSAAFSTSNELFGTSGFLDAPIHSPLGPSPPSRFHAPVFLSAKPHGSLRAAAPDKKGNPPARERAGARGRKKKGKEARKA